MEVFRTTLNQLVILFIMMGGGFALRKFALIDDYVTNGLSRILTQLILPIFVLCSFQMPYSHQLLMEGAQFFLVTIAFHLISFVIGLLTIKIFRVPDTKKVIWGFTCTFSNLTFMGLPIAMTVLGEEAAFYVSVGMMIFNFLIFGFGSIVLIRTGTQKEETISLKRIFITPLNISFVLGLLFFLTSFEMPAPVYSAFSSLSSMLTPLSMLVLGSFIAKNGGKQLFLDKDLYLVSFVRLFIIPIAVYYILILFPIDPYNVYVATILAAMPSAVVTAILADQYGGNADWASQAIFMSTVLSLFALPVVVLITLS